MEEIIKRLSRYSEQCIAERLDCDFAAAVIDAIVCLNTVQAMQRITEANESADASDEDEIPDNVGMYECFHCLSRSVIWDADFSFSDVGYDGDGLVKYCHCSNCGAEIEYLIKYTDCEDG